MRQGTTWEFFLKEGAHKEQSEGSSEEDPEPQDEVHHHLRETNPEPAELKPVLRQLANIVNNRMALVKELREGKPIIRVTCTVLLG